ncbi:AMP-binding protein [Nitrincola sp. MINF-07-Sa-05]|uniref:AMP-binding protein n=1 Tax=Nitrincola salilacus TaxID=3400273 RepID=UPI003917C575
MLNQDDNQFEISWSNPEQVIFAQGQELITVRDWLIQLQAVVQYCEARQGDSVLLYHPDTVSFSLWFCALTHLGKQIILAPNAQPETLAEAALHADWSVPESFPPYRDDSFALKQNDSDLLSGQPLKQSLKLSLKLSLSRQSRICFFTSGSTGIPKLIRKTLDQLLIEVGCLERAFGDALLSESVFAATVSHQHIYGLLFRILWPLSTERVIYRSSIAFFEQWQSLLEAHSVVLIASPAHLSRFAELDQLSASKSNISAIFSSGGPLADHLPSFYTEHLGQAPIEIFGSTETGGIAFRQRHGHSHRQQQQYSTFWHAFKDVTLSQADDGCLIIRSPYLDSCEPYQTQDQVLFHSPDSFELLGRADRIVKVEEKRLSLTELEKLCLQHPFIKEVIALVLSHSRVQLALVVVLTEQGQAQLEQQGKRALNELLRSHLSTRFERVQLPKKFRYVAQLPYNEQGKLPRQTLEALFL